jgi:Arc/MetJ-type ribon-helix-helix transcriptional regulator
MANKDAKPFPIQMEVEFLDRLHEPVRDGKAKSVSDIIRTALARYDFSDVLVLRPSQVQISVRLPAMIRQQLRKTARLKHTSVGQLVRAAVEAYLPELESQAAGQLEMAMPAPEPPQPKLMTGSVKAARRRRKPKAKARSKARMPAPKKKRRKR